MDLETSNAIESLRHDLEHAATDLADRMAVMDTSLRRQIATTEHTLRTELHEMRDEITGTLRAEMHEMRDELSRNAAVLTESVRDDVRIVAEGLAAVSAKIDALRR